MGILKTFALGMMLTMNGHPFLGNHSGGQPQPKTEEMADDWMQIQGPMGLGSVEKDGDRDDGDMGQQQGGDN